MSSCFSRYDLLQTDAGRRCWPFSWWWPLATSVGCGPGVSLCYSRSWLARSTAYRYLFTKRLAWLSLSSSLHSQNRQRKQTWHYKVGWVTDKEHANAVADDVTRNFSIQLGQRHIIISQSQVLSDEAALHTKEVKYIAGASLPGPQVGGRKGDQGRVGCLPSVPK